jgi:dihydroneopterin triphosphate diphosphatase
MPRAPFQVLVLPYRRSAAGLQVAVMHRADHAVWQFVSGGGEVGETEVGETIDAAARREGLKQKHKEEEQQRLGRKRAVVPGSNP